MFYLYFQFPRINSTFHLNLFPTTAFPSKTIITCDISIKIKIPFSFSMRQEKNSHLTPHNDDRDGFETEITAKRREPTFTLFVLINVHAHPIFPSDSAFIHASVKWIIIKNWSFATSSFASLTLNSSPLSHSLYSHSRILQILLFLWFFILAITLSRIVVNFSLQKNIFSQ